MRLSSDDITFVLGAVTSASGLFSEHLFSLCFKVKLIWIRFLLFIMGKVLKHSLQTSLSLLGEIPGVAAGVV